MSTTANVVSYSTEDLGVDRPNMTMGDFPFSGESHHFWPHFVLFWFFVSLSMICANMNSSPVDSLVHHLVSFHLDWGSESALVHMIPC